jgi:hypothetical protein
MGSVSGDRVDPSAATARDASAATAGAVCGDRWVWHFCGDHMGSVFGDRVEHLICYTETRSTR